MERRDIIECYGFSRKKRWRWFRSPYLVTSAATGVKFPDIKTLILPDLPPDSVVGPQVDAALEHANRRPERASMRAIDSILCGFFTEYSLCVGTST